MDQKLRVKSSIKKALSILALGLAYYLFVRLTGWGIPCVFSLVTGLLCPGCGISRMCMALLRLDFIGAFRYNAYVFCAIPFAAVFGLRHWLRWVKTGDDEMDNLEKVLVIVAAVLALAFGIMRNLDAFSFLAPA